MNQALIGNWATNKISNSLGLLRMMHDTNEKQATGVLNVVDVFLESSDDDLNLTRFDILDLFDQTRDGIRAAVGPIAQIYKSVTSEHTEMPFDPVYKDIGREKLEELIMDWLQD